MRRHIPALLLCVLATAGCAAGVDPSPVPVPDQVNPQTQVDPTIALSDAQGAGVLLANNADGGGPPATLPEAQAALTGHLNTGSVLVTYLNTGSGFTFCIQHGTGYARYDSAAGGITTHGHGTC